MMKASEQNHRLVSLRREIGKGLRDVKKGNVAELDMEEIIAEAKTLRAKQKHS